MTVSNGPITREEMIEMFGSEAPIEAINLIWNAPDNKTLADIRRELREIAAKQGRPQCEVQTTEPLAWLDLRTAGLSWQNRIIASNPQFVENNGPENFAPLHLHPAQEALNRDGAAKAASAICDYADNNVSMFDACCDEIPAKALEIYEAAKRLRDLLAPSLPSASLGSAAK